MAEKHGRMVIERTPQMTLAIASLEVSWADGGGAVGKCEGFAGSGGATAGEPGSDISGKDESGFQSTFPPSDQARSLGVNSPDNNRAFTSSSESGPNRFPSCET